MGRHQRLHRWLSGLLVGVRCHPPPGYTREIPADRRRPPSTEFPDCDPQARGFYRPLRGFQLRPRSPQAGSLLLFAARRQPEGYAVDAKSSTGVALGVGCRCKKQQAWRFDGRACTFLVHARSLRASELPVRAAKSGLSAAPSQPGRVRSGLRASGAGPHGEGLRRRARGCRRTWCRRHRNGWRRRHAGRRGPRPCRRPWQSGSRPARPR